MKALFRAPPTPCGGGKAGYHSGEREQNAQRTTMYMGGRPNIPSPRNGSDLSRRLLVTHVLGPHIHFRCGLLDGHRIYIYIYMYVYIHLFMCTRAMYVRMYICMCVCMYVCMYVRTYVRTYLRTYACMHACMNMSGPQVGSLRRLLYIYSLYIYIYTRC